LGGIFFFRFSALTIAREKGVRVSTEVMVRAWVGIVRRGVFQRLLENEELGASAQRGKLPETKLSRFRQREFSGHANLGWWFVTKPASATATSFCLQPSALCLLKWPFPGLKSGQHLGYFARC
jgi:hypothetical protein